MSIDTLSANGAGEWLKMPQGLCIILCSWRSWSTSEVRLDVAANTTGEGAEPLYSPDGDSAGVYVAKSDTSRQVMIYSDGDMAVRPTLSNYGGSPVTVRVRVSVPSKNNLV